MAQKRAALLEKRMRREKETQQKKMQLEAELEQKKEEARYVDTSGNKSVHILRAHRYRNTVLCALTFTTVPEVSCIFLKLFVFYCFL